MLNSAVGINDIFRITLRICWIWAHLY